MSTEIVKRNEHSTAINAIGYNTADMLMTIRVGNQLFGVPVLLIQDVLRNMNVTPIPLAASVIAGSMNLRGRTVTVIDMCKRLKIKKPQERNIINVVVEFSSELVSLQVDEVGDVLSLPAEKFEKSPPNLQANWRDITTGVYRLEEELLVVIDVKGLLDFSNLEGASKNEKHKPKSEEA